ncbi:MAG TPA: DUF4160 domain-containing protein [Gemmatimonadaceae bacterium]
MPTIKNIPGPYRFHFYSADCGEPMHIHAARDDAECKFWIDTMVLAENIGFSHAELRRIRRIILENLPAIMEVWREYCR